MGKSLRNCRRKGHDYGQGPGVLVELRVGDGRQTCLACEMSRERRADGSIIYYAPPELTKAPLGEVK